MVFLPFAKMQAFPRVLPFRLAKLRFADRRPGNVCFPSGNSVRWQSQRCRIIVLTDGQAVEGALCGISFSIVPEAIRAGRFSLLSAFRENASISASSSLPPCEAALRGQAFGQGVKFFGFFRSLAKPAMPDSYRRDTLRYLCG